MWEYAKANKDEIRECLSNIDWDSKFENLSVNDMVSEFRTTVLDILLRLIPNKIAICNDKDPPWITPEIKTAIKRKHRVYNKYVKRGRRLDEWENVRVIRYLSKYVSRDVLDQMYKLYVRPHLDYGDIIYHKFDPELTLEFTKKLETVQYSAALAVSGGWRGTNKCKLYEELGWEYLYHRRWYRRLIHFYKLKQSRLPSYLYNLIPPERELNYGLRRANIFDQPIERTNRYSNTYFQNCPKEWNRLDISVRSSQTISEFKKKLIQIVRPVKRSFFNVHDLYGVKLLTRLRVEFSDLRSHRYNHNFHCAEQGRISP